MNENSTDDGARAGEIQEIIIQPHQSNIDLNCRMYENKLPDAETCVMVNIRQITDVGTYVHLLEYNNIEGMILLSELTRRRIRSIGKLVKIGKNEVAVVMRVDQDKGYIDLSKRRAAAEDIQQCEERFMKSKAVHSIMRHVAERVERDLKDLYEIFGWPLYKKYGHLYDAFKVALVDPDSVFEGLDVPKSIEDEVLKNIRKRLTPQPIKIRSDIDCSCFSYEGIDAIKEALTAGQAMGIEQVPLKIKLVAPPSYVIETNCVDKNLGLATMEQAIEVIQRIIEKYDGTLVVKMKPRVVSQSDETELESLMETMGRENNQEDCDGDEIVPDEIN